jgi:hypothetical protein
VKFVDRVEDKAKIREKASQYMAIFAKFKTVKKVLNKIKTDENKHSKQVKEKQMQLKGIVNRKIFKAKELRKSMQ